MRDAENNPASIREAIRKRQVISKGQVGNEIWTNSFLYILLAARPNLSDSQLGRAPLYSLIIKEPDFTRILLKYKISYMLFHNPARAHFSKRKTHGHY
jgi:hypothetical protein